jgi:cation diffusion facilitator CzcD-associated flavoprotein CzcO
MCGGYYRYDQGYTPDFEGMDCYTGRIVHPQQWAPDIDYRNKRVVIIGSGATAVTLVPAMAETAAHVTMLQRSPSYLASLPSEDEFANLLRRLLPLRLAYLITRWKNILRQMLIYRTSQRYPEKFKEKIKQLVRQQLGPDFDVDTHFTPTYDPWHQRLCLVPDNDMFQALRNGTASVVTDHIECFTPTGLRLKSGDELDADLIVTATGFNLSFLSDVEISVDGKRLAPEQSMTYRGMMVSDVPNLAFSMGYTNASWTLKADLTSAYVCRLINHMDRKGYASCCPRNKDPDLTREPYLDFSSGYIQRSLHELPSQGSRPPWRLYQNYFRDIGSLRFGRLHDGVLEFTPADPN